jgi:hypothetical protein
LGNTTTAEQSPTPQRVIESAEASSFVAKFHPAPTLPVEGEKAIAPKRPSAIAGAAKLKLITKADAKR